MAEVKLNAFKREGTGKGVARRSRMSGRVPGVVYGRGMEPISIEVDRREFVTALQTDAGMNILIDLQIDGETTLALTKELQRDPVRGTLLHADFIQIDRKQEVEVEIPLHLIGEAAGAKEGGVLQHPLSSLHVRCLVTAVPESIDVDVSELNIGDSFRVEDLGDDKGYTVLTDPETVIASVTTPISEEELEAAIEEVAGEPEVVGEGEGDADADADAEAGDEAAAEGGEGSSEGDGEGE